MYKFKKVIAFIENEKIDISSMPAVQEWVGASHQGAQDWLRAQGLDWYMYQFKEVKE